MTKTNSKIFQFKIKLCDIKPIIWRRVQVLSTDTFNDLHNIIQNSMGWYDCHLHEFILVNPKTGDKNRLGNDYEDDEFDETQDEEKKTLNQYFSMDNKKARYVYDFGDDWKHDIVLEKILEKDQNKKYPQCVAGERACPPEDCGGVWGYENLLKIIADPTHKDYEEMKEWCGAFTPEAFDLSSIDLPLKQYG